MIPEEETICAWDVQQAGGLVLLFDKKFKKKFAWYCKYKASSCRYMSSMIQTPSWIFRTLEPNSGL
jgi:hypothetical protein